MDSVRPYNWKCEVNGGRQRSFYDKQKNNNQAETVPKLQFLEQLP
jgi:hypothetical protein